MKYSSFEWGTKFFLTRVRGVKLFQIIKVYRRRIELSRKRGGGHHAKVTTHF